VKSTKATTISGELHTMVVAEKYEAKPRQDEHLGNLIATDNGYDNSNNGSVSILNE
jgi:hypothetical protein